MRLLIVKHDIRLLVKERRFQSNGFSDRLQTCLAIDNTGPRTKREGGNVPKNPAI